MRGEVSNMLSRVRWRLPEPLLLCLLRLLRLLRRQQKPLVPQRLFHLPRQRPFPLQGQPLQALRLRELMRELQIFSTR